MSHPGDEEEARGIFLNWPQMSQSTASSTLLVKAITSVHSSSRRCHVYTQWGWGQYQSCVIRQTHGTGGTVVAIFGKYKIPKHSQLTPEECLLSSHCLNHFTAYKLISLGAIIVCILQISKLRQRGASCVCERVEWPFG